MDLPSVIKARLQLPGVVDALIGLAIAVDEWRHAECSAAGQGPDKCFGDNHVEDCPCEITRQGVLAAHDAIVLKLGHG